MKTNEIAIISADKICGSFENGSISKAGSIKVASLFGTWKQMGRQYGKLLSEELMHVYTFAERYVQRNGENAVNILLNQLAQISYSVRSFMEGVAETSGLTLPQLWRANAVERLSGLPMCSVAAAWDEFSKGPLIIGRNYDYGEQFFELKEDVIVTVYHPADGTLATATVGYAGEIYAVNAINERGIFMELNNGFPSAPVLPENDRITGTTLLLNIMFEADTLDYLDSFFNTALCSESYIINAADHTSAVSFEWCPDGMLRGGNDMPHGLLVSANHYVNPAWKYPVPTDAESWMSITRRNNLIRLCEENKGKIDAAQMREIISVDEKDGGAANSLTVYQLVAQPESRTLWLRVTGASDWTQIDMNSFLNRML